MLSPVSIATAPVKQVGAETTSSPAQARPQPAAVAAGEAGPANVRTETLRAVDAAKQAALPQKLREGETGEGRARGKDLPVGPPPAFEETLLEQRARLALEPPDLRGEIVESDQTDVPNEASVAEVGAAEPRGEEDAQDPDAIRAEAGFAESRRLAEGPASASVDVRS